MYTFVIEMYDEIKCCDRQTEMRQTGLSVPAVKTVPASTLSDPNSAGQYVVRPGSVTAQIQTEPDRAMPV